MGKIEAAVQWMESHAKDNSHGYDQKYRWGEKGDYDCSSAVISAWQAAGVPVKDKGATYTGNMEYIFKECGFQDITSSVNLASGSGLRRGDVLLNTTHHAAMYCGQGHEVEASINEKGKAVGGTPGDQTGKEFLIRQYRNYPWTNVLRYMGDSETASSSEKIAVDGFWAKDTTLKAQHVFGTVADGIVSGQNINCCKYLRACLSGVWQFSAHPTGSALIKAIQRWAGAEADGIAGRATVPAMQKKLGATADGYLGKKTCKAFQKWLNKQ